MDGKMYLYDPTADDPLSKVRGVGRYLQILKENFPEWIFTNKLKIENRKLEIFINPFFNFLKPPLVRGRIAKKQIAVIHDIIPLKYPEHFPAGLRGNINIFLNQFTLKQYDLVVTDSQASKKDIIDLLHIPENKIKVIYPVLPKIFLNNRHPERSEGSDDNKIPTNFCLYIGDATWNKNLVNIARAIKEINVTCVFVGKVFEQAKTSEVLLKKSSFLTSEVNDNGWQKELNEFFYETAGDKRFIFTGYLPDIELIKLYQQAEVNILVSRDEGFGFSYLEAASQGCPSILSDIPVLHEISGDKGALFVDHKKVSDIANVIGGIYFHREKRQMLGSEAHQRTDFFSPNTFKKSFQEIV